MSKFKVGDRIYDIPSSDDGYTKGYGEIVHITKYGYDIKFDHDLHLIYRRKENQIRFINSELVKEKLGLQKAKK